MCCAVNDVMGTNANALCCQRYLPAQQGTSDERRRRCKKKQTTDGGTLRCHYGVQVQVLEYSFRVQVVLNGTTDLFIF